MRKISTLLFGISILIPSLLLSQILIDEKPIKVEKIYSDELGAILDINTLGSSSESDPYLYGWLESDVINRLKLSGIPYTELQRPSGNGEIIDLENNAEGGSPSLYVPVIDGTLQVGETVRILLRGKNNGVSTTDDGYVSLSLPQFCDAGYGHTWKPIYNDPLDQDYKYQCGDNIWTCYGNQTSAYHVLVDGYEDGWSSGEWQEIYADVTLYQSGNLVVYSKMNIGTTRVPGGGCQGPDQQSWPVYQNNFTVLPAPAPDMIVNDLWTVPSNPTAGEEIDLYVEIKNIGNATASNINLKYYIDGSYVGNDSHSSLSPGSTQTEYYPNYIFTTGGNYDYEVEIDPVSGENNTSNNNDNITINVQDYWNAEVTYINVSSNPMVGQPVQIVMGIKNLGSTQSSYKAKLQVQSAASGNPIVFSGWQSVYDIGVGQTKTATFNWTPSTSESYRCIGQAWNWQQDYMYHEMIGSWFYVSGQGNITSEIKNIDGTSNPIPGDNGIIKLYNNSNNLIDTENTTNGTVTFSNVPFGDYYFKAWHNSGQTIFGDEYWGKTNNITVNGNENVNFQRYMPYHYEVNIYANGNNVTWGSIPLGTTLQIELIVENPGSSALNCQGRLVLDQNQNAPYDLDELASTLSVPGYGQKTFNFIYTPSSVGDFYRAAGIKTFTEGAYLYTDGTDWGTEPIISVYEPTGNLNAEIKNIDGTSNPLPGDNGIIELYDISNNLIDTKATNNGSVDFSNLPYGDYYFKVFHNNGQTIYGDEYWGRSYDFTIPYSGTYEFCRYMPYHHDVIVYADGNNVTNGSVSLGTPLTFEVIVKNPNTSNHSCQAQLTLDTDQSYPYPYSNLHSSLQVPANGQQTFTFNFTPTEAGDYYRSAGVKTLDEGSYRFTDGTDWGTQPIITVLPPEQIEITVTDANNNPANGVIVYQNDASWQYILDQQTTTGNGTAVFEDFIDPNTIYHFQAYFPSIVVPNESEYWGYEENVSVPAGGFVSKTIERAMPYINNYEVLDANLNPETNFALGQTVVLRWYISNYDVIDHQVKVHCQADRDKTGNMDFDQVCSFQNITTNTNDHYQDFYFTPIETGDYYIRPFKTITDFNWDTEQLTDSWDWWGTPEFNVFLPSYNISGKAKSDINNFDVIPDATVSLIGAQTYSTTTSGDGTYSFENIPEGNYELSIIHDGYFWAQSTFNLVLNQNIAQDFEGHCKANPEISYNIPSTFTPGVPFNIDVIIKNTNFAISGVSAYLDVSFPDFPDASNVLFVTQNGFDSQPEFKEQGDLICYYDIINGTLNCNFPAQYLLVTAQRSATLYNQQEWSFTLTITPPEIQELKIHVKGSMGDQRDPNNGITGQQGLWEEEIVLTSNTQTYEDDIWLKIHEDNNYYDIHVVSENPIPDLQTRPLKQSIDESNIQYIYLLENGNNIVETSDAADLLLKAQSSRKYPLGDFEMTDLLNTISPGDIEIDNRNPWWGGSAYTVWIPYATRSWWNELFVFGGLVPGLDEEIIRIERYADVLLDCVLQPDIADNLDEQQDLINDLGILKTFLVDPSVKLTLEKIWQASPGIHISKNEIQTTLTSFHQTVKNKHLIKFFDNLNIALGSVLTVFDMTADATRFLFLQSLANAKAEERLEALEAWIISNPNIDPALTQAIFLTKQNFEDYIDNEWYDQLAEIIDAAIVGNLVELGELTVEIGVYLNLLSAPIKKVLLPYFLSWEVYKLIREQAHNAQHCVIAASIWNHLFNSNFLTEQKNLVDFNLQISTANNLVHLSNISTYLGWYFYDRYLSISNNTLSGWFGNALDFLNLWGWSNYSVFIDHLEGKGEFDLDYYALSCPPIYLTQHYSSFNTGASDVEYAFLLGKLINYVPSLVPPQLPIQAEFSVDLASGTAPMTVNIQNLSTGPVIQWDWDFGDGTSYSGQDPPPHIYITAGNFSIVLSISDGINNASSSPRIISVQNASTVANFNASNNNGTAPLTINFTNNSSGVNNSYTWSFGDGGISNDVNPTYIYNDAGTFTVSLVANGLGGQDVETKVDYIVVQGASGTIEVYTNNSNSSFYIEGPENHTGNGEYKLFQNTAIGDYTIHYMDIQGYETPASETKSLSNGATITFNGVYVSNNNPLLSWTGESNFVSDGLHPETGDPTTTFTYRINYSDADGDPPNAGFPKVYIRENGQNISGSPFEMNEANQNPFVTGRIYTFDVSGLAPSTNYTYQFEAKDINDLIASGDGTNITPGPVVNYVLMADFSASSTNINTGQSVQFTNLSTGNITQWTWTFEGGDPATFVTTTSGEDPPPITYNTAGTWDVTLEVSDGTNSATELKQDYITVTESNTGLVAWYPFNGNADDESGNGNHGTVVGSILTSDRFGNPNSAYYFDGIDDKIEIGDKFDTEPSLSITAWAQFEPNSQGAIRSVISKHGDYGGYTGKSFNIYKNENDDKLKTRVYGSNENVIVQDNNPVSFGDWVFIVLTFGEGEAKLYVNGANVCSESANFMINNTSTSVIIGDNATNNHPFLGKIDDIRIYDRVLSGMEISDLYQEDFMLNTQVMLEGPFSGSGMNTSLNNTGYLPLNQPFNKPPWNYNGTESVSSIPNSDIVDWILVELRETSGGPETAYNSTMIERKAAFLKSDGTIVDMNGSAFLDFGDLSSSENLYLVVWHRNHLGIMSNFPLINNGWNYEYLFYTSEDRVYGGSLGHKEIYGTWVMISGDGNSDGSVGTPDKNDVWILEAGMSGYLSGDYDMNSQVDNADKIEKWAPNGGKSSQVPGPEPNTNPNAIYTVTPQNGNTTTIFNFDASGCYDLEDPPELLEVRWDWENDGTWDTPYSITKTATHQYSQPATYSAKLEVRDSGGLTDTETQVIEVIMANTPPVAVFTITPSTGTTSTIFSFDASGSYDNEDPIGLLEVRWDWEGDGVWDTPYSTTKTITYQYSQTNTYTVRMEIKDTGGLTDISAETVVVSSSCTGTITYGIQTYNLVEIGNQCWLKENMNYMTGNSWCYNENASNCDTYGRLYDWETAITVCPQGWHLPTDAEWCTLEQYVDNTITCSSIGWRGTDGGGKLKEAGIAHWASPNIGATNSSGFTALPGGDRDINGNYSNLGNTGYWWSASESGSGAWGRALNNEKSQVRRNLSGSKYNGFSVRCVQD